MLLTVLLLLGFYLGGFTYVFGVASTDPNCPDRMTALWSALGWPYGLLEVMRSGGGVGR